MARYRSFEEIGIKFGVVTAVQRNGVKKDFGWESGQE